MGRFRRTIEEEVEHAPHLVLRMLGERYALPIAKVREIVEPRTATRVPGTPDFVEGVINLRGQVVPVVDLRRKVGLPRAEAGPEARTVILALEGGRTLAIAADAVEEVASLDPEHVESPPAFGTTLHADVLTGSARLGAGFVLLVDLERLLSIEALLDAPREAPLPSGAARPMRGEA